ncbi:MAG TPA: hypothetical protein VEF03_09380 [Candidatus Binataceae bacterium]|nr:hypothetical protein [Candidatus Binataceae bacterium]
MKFRYAAVLALAFVSSCWTPAPPPSGSYYLMFPPTGINAPKGDPNAPLSRWSRSGYRVYSSREDCERMLGSEHERVDELGADVAKKVTSPAQCIATDDPRLAE